MIPPAHTQAAPLAEAEIQYLIVLAELHHPVETPNNNHYLFHPLSEEEAARYFLSLRADWTPAIPVLAERRLIEFGPDGWRLTRAGKDVAFGLRGMRPPIYYWYRQFYPVAARSQAYAEFCRRLYGIDLTQAGFSSIEELQTMASVARLNPSVRALDLGCGLGRIAEYFSDTSGAHFHGVDYCPEALDLALLRTARKSARLGFSLGEMDTLTFPPGSFDVITAIDSLYMPANLPVALSRLLDMLRPGGRLLAYYTYFVGGAHDAGALNPDNTPLGRALLHLGRTFTTWDFSESAYYLLQRKRQVGEAMREDFEAEGSRMLYDYIIAESSPDGEPYRVESCPQARYLYLVEA